MYHNKERKTNSNKFLTLLDRAENLNEKDKRRFSEIRGRIVSLNKEKRNLDPKLVFRLNLINKELDEINGELQELLYPEEENQEGG